MSSPADLQNSVSFIREYGYGIIANVFSSPVRSAVSEELSRTELKRSRAGARHVLSLPSVSEIANRNELLSLARGVLGAGAIPFRATFFDKSANSNWLVAWHQDTALPLTRRSDVPGWGPWSMKGGIDYAHAPAAALRQVLALRIHLDDSTAANGPLQVVPRTHEIGVLTDTEIQRRVNRSERIPCLVPAGGIVAMRPLILHASSKSRSDQPRRIVHIEYALTLDICEGLQLAIV